MTARTPPALAGRLDRLARRAHRFHRFAHHPLCGAYASEVVRLPRRVVICRGCALATTGGAAGIVAGIALPLLSRGALAALVASAALTAICAALPRAGRARSKLLSRAAPAALLAGCAAHALRHLNPATALVALAAAIAAWAAVGVYRRRGPDRAPCAACPELGGARACSGYRPILRRERAFARVAARLARR